MEYLVPGDRIHILNRFTAGRIKRTLEREGYVAEIQGEYVVVIEDREGFTENKGRTKR